MVLGYYQLGGFRPQIQWFRHDEKKLAQAIAGEGSPLRVGKAPVELIHGIKHCGTSHLLLTESQAWDVVNRLRLPAPTVPPTPSTAFESLSPIEFWDGDELAYKLGTLKPKSHKGRAPVDNSQINKQYDTNGRDGIQRGAFEHGRLLYQIMHGAANLRKYALSDASWMNSIRICSFVFNTRVDERTSKERLTNPMIIDVGITNGHVPDLDETTGTMHFELDRNLRMQQRLPFKHGVTEVLGDFAIGSRLQAFLEPRSDTHPTILLVHDEERSRNVLRNMGVDISAWQSGLKRLLGFEIPHVRTEASSSRTSDPRRRPPDHSDNSPSFFRGGYDQRQHRSRSRSRSPSRPQYRVSKESYPSQYDYPHRPPPRSRDSYNARHNHHERAYPRTPDAFAPVYVVDVQQLYKKLMQTDFGAENVIAISRQLKLTNDDSVGCCAGNEAVMLIEIWRSMISGSSIDDQRAFRNALSISLKSESAEAKASDGAPAGDSDEERDPNDIVQNPNPTNILSFPDDPDSDDYGSSDSGY